MKRISMLLITGGLMFGAASETGAQDVGLKWLRDFGSARDSEYGLSIHTDEAGFVYTTGSVGDMINFNRQGTTPIVSGFPGNVGDVFVTKHNTDGELLWVRTMGGVSSERGNAITTDKDGNVYVTGSFSGVANFDPGGTSVTLTTAGAQDIFVVKLNSTGAVQWAKGFGSTNTDDGTAIAADTAGNVYIAGKISGDVDFDNITLHATGAIHAFTAKLNTNGDVLWAHAFGTGGPRGTEHGAEGICLDQDANVHVVGYFASTVDFNPDPVATSNLTSAGDFDPFILKLTKDGNFVWVKGMEGSGQDKALAVRVDGAGNVYTGGWFMSSLNANPGGSTPALQSGGGWNGFLAKHDANGNYAWAFRVGGVREAQVLGVATDVDDNVYITGYYDGTVNFDPAQTGTQPGPSVSTSVGSWDIFAARYSPGGDFVWVKTAGGTGDPGSGAPADVAQAIAVDTGYNVYVTGFYQGTVDFDPGPGTENYTTAGRTDVFIWKLRCPMTESATVVTEMCSSTYEWNGVLYTESGVYTQDFYLGEGCDSVATLQLTLGEAVEKPIINVDHYTLSVRSGYASYQWIRNDTAVSGATDSVFVVQVNANYQVAVSNDRGCTDTSDVYQVNNVSIAGLDAHTVTKIIPNPARTKVYLTGTQPHHVTIATLDGRQVLTQKHTSELYIGELPTGIYIVTAYDKHGAVLIREKLTKID